MKLLTTLENLVVEVALWVLLVPKTLLHIVCRPQAILVLADATGSDGEPRSQDEYVSLVLLWLVIGVLPGIPIITSQGGPEWIANPLLRGLGVESTVTAAATLLLLGPLAFAAAETFVAGRRLGRSSLRRPFAVHCGCFAPFFLAYFVAVFFHTQALLTTHEHFYNTVAVVMGIGGVGWFLAAELIVLRRDLDSRALRPAAAFVLGVLFWLGLMSAARFVLLLMNVYYS